MSRSITVLRRRIVKMRQRTPPVSWIEICRRLHILTDGGNPNTGLADDIGFKVDGNGNPYEPRDPDVRERLGLTPVCPTCGRRINKKKAVTSRIQHPRKQAVAWWYSLSALEREAFINEKYEQFAYIQNTEGAKNDKES
jgi:hypothetical protein